MLVWALASGLAVLAWTCQGAAQSADAPGIATLNQERLYAGSDYGARVAQVLETASAELAAENRTIEARLMAEERELTEQRPDMDPDAFRERADAFDARVEEIRDTQRGKERRLAAAAEAARQRFFEMSVPILLQLLDDRGVDAILDSRAVILAPGSIDITDAAIARIDEQLGEADAATILDDMPEAPAPEDGVAADPEAGPRPEILPAPPSDPSTLPAPLPAPSE